MKTKLLNGILMFLMCSVFCLEAIAQNVGDTFTESSILYRVTVVGTPNEVYTQDYTGTNTVVNIPEEVTDTATGYSYEVTGISQNAFAAKSLTSVTIPNSIISIAGGAFSFNSLTSVTIPNSVTSMYWGAFYNNSLTSVTFSEGLIYIADEVFAHNSLTSFTIPNHVIEISDGAFGFNSLTNVTIPNSVGWIGSGAFRDNSLTSLTIGDSVNILEDYAFLNNPLTSVVSTSTNPVTLLSNVFDNRSTIDLTIPSGTEQVYIDADWTGFNQVVLSIEENVFNNTISTYPNPVTDVLNISLATEQTIQKVELYNLLGKKIVATNNTAVDFNSVSAGIYILKITSTEGEIATRKIIKQ